LGIPRLESKDIERISKQAVDVDSQTLTADLVVKSWLIQREKADVAYLAWEKNIVSEIMKIAIQ